MQIALFTLRDKFLWLLLKRSLWRFSKIDVQGRNLGALHYGVCHSLVSLSGVTQSGSCDCINISIISIMIRISISIIQRRSTKKLI